MSDMTVSAVVQDFDRVAIDPRLSCPSCGAAFTPHAMCGDEVENGLDTILTFTLRCQSCHADALSCAITLQDDDEGGDE